MNYERSLKKFTETKQQFVQAEKALLLAKNSLAKARKSTPKLHEKLTDVMALQDVGDATSEEVNEAKTKHEQACKNLDEAKTQVTAKEKAVNLFRQKVNEAKSEYLRSAYPHYQKKSLPVIQQFEKAFQALAEARKEQDELISEMREHDVDPSLYVPGEIQEFQMKINHLRHLHTPEKWLAVAAEKNDNFKPKNS